MVVVGAGSACPILSPCFRGDERLASEGVNILPQFLPLTLWICVLFQVFLSQLFVVKKLQKPPAQVSKLAYLATLVVKNSSKLGFPLICTRIPNLSQIFYKCVYICFVEHRIFYLCASGSIYYNVARLGVVAVDFALNICVLLS